MITTETTTFHDRKANDVVSVFGSLSARRKWIALGATASFVIRINYRPMNARADDNCTIA